MNKAGKTFSKAKLWARCTGDCVDAVVEAVVGKLSMRMKLMVQGVEGGANPFLLATFLRLHHPNGETGKKEGG